MSTPDTKHLNVPVPSDILDKLTDFSLSQGLSKKKIVENALRQYMYNYTKLMDENNAHYEQA